MSKVSVFSGMALFMIFTFPPAFAGEIIGTVKWEGKAPKMRPIQMAADAVCAAAHGTAPTSESLVVGADGGVANVLVHVTGGLPAGKTYPAPTTPAVMDQKGCMYMPHVLGVMTGQDLDILNSDGILHNVKVNAKNNKSFNIGMPKNMKKTTKTFDKPELPITFKCNVHPWMKSYIAVLEHPFFAVTGADGSFKIEGLPAGTYQVEAWQESKKVDSVTMEVKVTDGSTTQNFTLKRAPKK